MPSTVLITGSNRGIGLELLRLYLSQAGNTVISAVRDPTHSSTQAIQALPTAEKTRHIVVGIDSASPSTADAAIKELKSRYNITSIDTVIANAGIGESWVPARETSIEAADLHFAVNAVGPLALFRAVRPLLLASSSTPRFVVISTVLGSIGDQGNRPIPDTAYGMSKAAVNFLVGKIHHEEENLVTFPIHPGWVQTPLGNSIATAVGMKEAAITQEVSAAGVYEQIEKSTKEASSGKFIDYQGNSIPW
ncbi:hypothetical protein H2200_006519 [Cladophialophora chaetospira]|uniref:Norsolorinic acid ketoreductase n=1 Tax=Cladophialophora chaetospira TaxID=386627 RepID=A0AA38X8C9_9EURO|nr:hypothetical protein H2200_006519 [Cladophialophora chaetospira]